MNFMMSAPEAHIKRNHREWIPSTKEDEHLSVAVGFLKSRGSSTSSERRRRRKFARVISDASVRCHTGSLVERKKIVSSRQIKSSASLFGSRLA